MVSNLVSNSLWGDTAASAIPPLWLPYMCLTRDRDFASVNFAECVLRGAVDSFAYTERGDCLCILLIRGVCYYIITPYSLKKRENSVGSVGSVGKSEKSPEKIL